MVVDVPAVIFKAPRKYDVKNRETGEKTGQVRFIQTLVLEGEKLDCFVDTDLTVGLNGLRDQIGTGRPVEVVATLDIHAFDGKLRHNLESLSAPEPVKG